MYLNYNFSLRLSYQNWVVNRIEYKNSNKIRKYGSIKTKNEVKNYIMESFLTQQKIQKEGEIREKVGRRSRVGERRGEKLA